MHGMRIAVIDVAAESGGALSVLKDFLGYLLSLENDENEYYVFVSKEIGIVKNNIHYILKPEIKKSWLNRLKWERIDAIKEFRSIGIDLIFSLQNTGFFTKDFKQIVYFHNVLLLEPRNKYSMHNKEERLYGVYTKVIAPYTIKSLKYANTIICQTNTVKQEIEKRVSGIKAVMVNPNVYVSEEYINTAVRPIKGYIYPTAAVPFKKIEEVIECVKENQEWFAQNHLEMLITINGNENKYAGMIYEMGRDISCIKYIGYQKRERILELYRDHALIINSELESFPLPFKEAELVGAPIVAVDYPYANEILSTIDDSYLYQKNNIKDFWLKLKITYESQYKRTMDRRFPNSWATIYALLKSVGEKSVYE